MKEEHGRLISYGAALAGDVISSIVPGGGLLAKAIDQHLARRSQEAVEIAIDELSKGNVDFDEADAEPFVAILLRYSKAASEGAARKNLRLLMQVVVGLKKNKSLKDDLFRRWASILEHMTRDELMLVGQAIILQRKKQEGVQAIDENFWQLIQDAMVAGRYLAEELPALGASVSRYGILVPKSAWGGIVYAASPWLEELAKLVDVSTFLLTED